VSAGVQFAEVQRLLSLFAQGIAGTYLHLKIAKAPTTRAQNPIADAGTIYLSAHMSDVGAYRIALLHQIGYLTEGTVDFDLDELTAAWPRPALLRRVFVIIEDLRIDAAIRRDYPGARRDLDRVLMQSLTGRPPPHTLRPLSALLEALLQFSLGASREDLLREDSSGLLRGIIDAACRVEAKDAKVNDSAEAARKVCMDLEDLFPRRARQNLGRETPPNVGADIEIGRDPSGTPGITGGEPDDLASQLEQATGEMIDFRGDLNCERTLRGRRASNGAASMGAQQGADSTAVPTTMPTSTASASARRKGLPPGAREEARSFLYDEWDYGRQSYLTAWCRLYELRLRGEDFAFIAEARRRHSSLALEVRRQFGFIKPEAWHRVRRTSDGDELELDGMIEAVVDRRTGHANDSHLYVRRDRARRDVAAAFLVDMSASTDFPLPDPIAAPAAAVASTDLADRGLYLYGGHDEAPEIAAVPKRRVIDVSKDALALMCDALQRLGDSHAIYGFSGDGRDSVEFYVAKDFADRLTARTWAALAGMQPRRSTRMGTAIRHAITKLAREPASMKVLIIVSDGYPEDHDYGPDRTDREYGIQDTARALAEAQSQGIVYFCITIDPAGHDYLRRMCSESHYLVIDDVSALPRELTKVYRGLTQR
jgi:nitric oxide reductase NorD protein